MPPVELVWFRNDLRAQDHRALASARQRGSAIGLYVISPGDWRRFGTAACRVEFTLRNLRALSTALRGLNIPLLIRTAADPTLVPSIVVGVAREHGCGRVHWHSEDAPWEDERDDLTRGRLASDGIACEVHHDQCVLRPGTVRTKTGGPYTVFTPFKNAWLAQLEREGGPGERLTITAQAPSGVRSDPIPDRIDGFASGVDAGLWPGGEAEARRRLDTFVRTKISAYRESRDFPAAGGTSALSPYLASGVISARECVRAAMAAGAASAQEAAAGAGTWISELVWREFYKHVLAAFPRVGRGRAFKLATDRIRWNRDAGLLTAWQQGRTGVPIVDAAMRCLESTGWMHNRLRMICAMYLTKDLFLDWREGERWFMARLVDGDLSQNNGGWQWSAGTGTDAAPYFRIFNPYMQSAKFDPEGVFIRRWVPELAGVRGDAIHHPAELGPSARAGLDYPDPIVDHARARDRVLRAFEEVAG